MQIRWGLVWTLFSLLPAGSGLAQPVVVFETTSPYHHIRVIDEAGLRTLSFDGSMETQMLLANPLRGHFDYTDFFHMPWLWNNRITNVLMIGLGGASTQRSYQHYYPQVTVETVELDPLVLQVARQYFLLKESPRQKVHLSDGRVFLRRSRSRYDVMILDAYRGTAYGSFIPYHLATKEFFQLAGDHLTAQGILAYNVIGSVQDRQSDIVGSIYQTMKTVFPQIYMFPASKSQNVVLVGTKASEKLSFNQLHQRAAALIRERVVTLPGFHSEVYAVRTSPPWNAYRCPVLTDDYAPIDGLLTTGRPRGRRK